MAFVRNHYVGRSFLQPSGWSESPFRQMAVPFETGTGTGGTGASPSEPLDASLGSNDTTPTFVWVTVHRHNGSAREEETMLTE